MKHKPIAIALLALAIAACAPAVQTTERTADSAPSEPQVQISDRVEPAPSPSPSEPQVEGGDNVEEYFRAFASQDPRDMKDMADLAADDSPALTYANVQYAAVVAQQQSYGGADGMNGPQTMSITDDGGVELCDEPLGFEGDIGGCFTFTDFELTDGKIASFSAVSPEGGDPVRLDDRIVSGGQRQEIAGNTVRLVGAYHSIESDRVFMVISTDAAGDSIEYGYGDTYETSDGREVASTEYLGDDQPRGGRKSFYVVTFDSVDLPGTVRIQVSLLPNYDQATLTFDLQGG